MKKLLLLLLVFAFSLPAVLAERKKVGLVLSGGGAKGMSHIGAIKVIERAGIPIDYVVGTSIGSIVGGLYAIGYDAAAIDSMARTQDWMMLLSDKVHRNKLFFAEKDDSEKFIFKLNFDRKEKRGSSGFVHGQNINNLFTELTIGYHDTLSFRDFSIPFACITANLVDRNEIVVDKGNLAMAMRASMAIPGVFVPIYNGQEVYVDGGIVNNFPVDIAKEMGADIVIGIDLQANFFEADQLNTFQGMMGQIINILCMNKHEENKALTDLYIRPDIDEFSAASFTKDAVDTMIIRGERAAEAHWKELLELKARLGISEDDVSYARSNTYRKQDTFYIHKIRLSGVSEKDEKWIRRALRIKEKTIVTKKDINETVSDLYGTKLFSNVDYRLLKGPEYELELRFIEDQKTALNFGFRFDTEEMAALLINTKMNQIPFRGSALSLTTRLSKSPFFRIDYSIENPLFRKLDIAYMFKYNDFNIYRKGDRTNSITFRYHQGEIAYTNFFFKNMKFQLGLRYEYHDYDPTLYKDDEHLLDIESRGSITYFAEGHWETFDRRYYPTRGLSLKASYSLYTDNFATYNDDAPFGAIAADFSGVISLSNRFKVIPSVYGRVLIGSGIPFQYLNYVGGNMSGRYMPQQLTFDGIEFVELFENSVVATKLSLRQRMGSKHYLTLTGNYALHHNRFFDILGSDGMFGGSIGYSYDLATGPVDVVFSMSDWSKEVVFYFNLGFYF